MKRAIVKRHRVCDCEAYPFCEHATNAKTPLESLKRFTQEDIDALDYILDLAHGDQREYLNNGDPRLDYGSEWPLVSTQKAEWFNRIASIAERLGLHQRKTEWEDLAKDMEASGKEYEQETFAMGDHIKVLHGLCKICGHYGEDCTGVSK